MCRTEGRSDVLLQYTMAHSLPTVSMCLRRGLTALALVLVCHAGNIWISSRHVVLQMHHSKVVHTSRERHPAVLTVLLGRTVVSIITRRHTLSRLEET